MPGDRRTTGERCSWGGPTHACGGKLRLRWVGYRCCSQRPCLHFNAASKVARPTHGSWRRETQICLVLEAFLLSSGNLELCLHPQAHLLTCQRWGNSFSPTYCLPEGVRFSPDSLGTWLGSNPHTITSELILGLWLSFHLATAPSDECTIQRHSCHLAVRPYGTTGKTTPAFYQRFKLICWPVKSRCWEHPLPPCSTEV